MWLVLGIIFFTILFICVMYALTHSVPGQVIVETVTKFKKKGEKEEDHKKYLEKKQRQIEQFQENIRASQNNQAIHYTETRVVEIKKPIGKWTRLITMTQLKYISNVKKLMGEKFSSKLGFWQMKVKAQAMSQGKEKGRGR